MRPVPDQGLNTGLCLRFRYEDLMMYLLVKIFTFKTQKNPKKQTKNPKQTQTMEVGQADDI